MTKKFPIGAALEWGVACLQRNEAGFYESNPAGYEAIVELFHRRRKIAEAIAEVIKGSGSEPKNFLDTACGTGLVIDTLARTAPSGSTFIGMDLSDPSLAFASQTKDLRIQWKQGNFENLEGIQADTIDVYTMVAGYRHIQEAGKFYGEIERVLAPGGIAVLPQCRPGDMSSRDLDNGFNLARTLGLEATVCNPKLKDPLARMMVGDFLVLKKPSAKGSPPPTHS